MKILVDLYCCAGGATKGYQRAGFYVIGVDNKPQPNYCGDAFIEMDVLQFLAQLAEDGKANRGAAVYLDDIAAFHASPPCQTFTAYRRKGHGVGDGYLNLISETRDLLRWFGLPYVIENVVSARDELVDPITLCGSMFGLDVQRHRLFETNFPLEPPTLCDHSVWTPRFAPATNRTNLRKTVEVGVWRIPLHVQQAAMGIDWTTLRELSEAIPPAYTEHIGGKLADRLVA